MEFEIVGKRTALCAKTESGKSRLIRYFVNVSKDEFDGIFCVCPTENRKNGFYSKFVEPENIFYKYSDKWVKALMKDMEKKNEGILAGDPNMKKVLVIFDDVCADENISTVSKHFKWFKALFCRGRHCGISVLITCQYPNNIPPTIRGQLDFMCVGQLNARGLECLIDEFRQGKITRREFEDLYYESTCDYNFLIIKNNTVKNSGDITQIYSTVRCPENMIN
jgi:hypothetical protein